ncbi:MAG: hypothetical protein ABIH46_09015 [Chloroflexota bacterium]
MVSLEEEGAEPTELEAEPETEPCYRIDLPWFDQHSRSFTLLAQARMCESCREKLGTEVEVSEPEIDKKSGKVVFRKRKAPFGSNPFVVVRDCCSKKGWYVDPEQPLLEIVFRIFLANANQPLNVEQIRGQMEEWLGDTVSSRDVSPERLQRILDGDAFYGLQRVESSQQEEASAT